ncbi:uncharacterized protein PHACADRAFT_265604 [Phanerochaete carnosa HHB-10118-sp]|uniref:Protein kinase domain-containing protein n=1 Tax=Phanerochaete carnosa (strain HHB-10118-sp) TaxID=650164 RepID=K5VSX8_PHACS|nr:uncharacterized protein PHACADRAFT_265604 [Phanerochaete carnosa HHB-10118-sp]EKM49860.1 hypothetical protein PHACADRAFT_265604 [Phanerochaete carnosa HHB-10118-sp]
MLNSTRSGNERYLAPEQTMPNLTDKEMKTKDAIYGVPTRFISSSNRPTTQTDLFSFAMLCIELYTGDNPFQGVQNGSVTREIMHGKRPALPKEIAGQRLLSARIERCWRQNPGEREDAGRLLDDMRRIATYDRV